MTKEEEVRVVMADFMYTLYKLELWGRTYNEWGRTYNEPDFTRYCKEYGDES